MRFLIALALTCSPAFADADGPDAWRVTGVSAGDVLNLRMGPGTKYPKSGSLEPQASGLKAILCVPTLSDGQYFALSEVEQAQLAGLSRWCYMEATDGVKGWASMRYMEEDSQ